MGTTLGRIRISWLGFPGAPGVSTFYATDPLSLTAPLHTFFAAIAGLMPTDVSIVFPGTGDNIDDASGQLVGQWSQAAQATVPGTSATVYKAPVGLCADWLTGTIIGKRRLQGRTFIVPVSSASDTATGAPLAASITTLSNAAAALVTAGTAAGWRMWHRPKSPAAGSSGIVTASRIPNKFVTLRSRRD